METKNLISGDPVEPKVIAVLKTGEEVEITEEGVTLFEVDHIKTTGASHTTTTSLKIKDTVW